MLHSPHNCTLHLELFPSEGRHFTHNMGRSSDKQFTRCRLPRNCSTILWCTEALRWTGQQQDEVERVTGGGKSSIVSIEGKKLKDPSRTYTWAPLRHYTLLSSILICRIPKEIPSLILKAHFISSDRTETGTTRMNVVITSWLSITQKCQSPIFNTSNPAKAAVAPHCEHRLPIEGAKKYIIS